MEWPIITKDTPLEEIKLIHQCIWDYVIEHGVKPYTPYNNNCVACKYALFSIQNNKVEFKNVCTKCPIAWPGDVKCFHIISLYGDWRLEKDPEKKRELAKQIRDIPFKYEVDNDREED